MDDVLEHMKNIVPSMVTENTTRSDIFGGLRYMGNDDDRFHVMIRIYIHGSTKKVNVNYRSDNSEVEGKGVGNEEESGIRCISASTPTRLHIVHRETLVWAEGYSCPPIEKYHQVFLGRGGAIW